MTRYALLLAVLSFSMTYAEGQGFLKAKGRIIVNEKGEKVILRGMGLGGWMLQEGYMLRLGAVGQQYRIREKITDLAGTDKTQAFYQGWLDNHTRKTDIDSMAAWGFNSVRIPLHYRLFEAEKGFIMLDSLLGWCRSNKIYLILDMHAAPGGQGNDLAISDRDPAEPSLWQSEANRQKMIDLWKKLAKRYANEPWIGGYDIINEPNWGFEDTADRRGIAETKNIPLRKLMMDITKAIRSVDKKHMIIIEGNGFGNNYRGVLPPWDDNMVLSFHKYGNFNTEASIRSFLDLRDKYNIPLWMGESGENSNTWYTEAIRLVETHDIGWSWWPLKKMGNNNPLEIKIPRGYQRMLDYWGGKGPRPTQKEAQDALDDVVEAIRCENNIYHKDVVDAMFRQVYSDETLPFKQHIIGSSTLIPAVDYDLGRQGAAYFDRDSASYQYTPGVKTQGNRGHMYRNDGVDIGKGPDGFYVFSIEAGEWLQYTVDVEKDGKYDISFQMACLADSGHISLYDGEKKLTAFTSGKIGGESDPAQVLVKGVDMTAGRKKLRFVADKGGLVLYALIFERE